MQSDWQTFLTAQGATIAAGLVQRFGDTTDELQAAAQGTVLCDLSQFSTLRVSGAEAQSFLQNLLSNDIREVGSDRAQLSSFNSAKGRMLATLMIWRDDEDYLLQLPQVLAEAMRKKLGMYVLRAKVKISDAGDTVILLGLSGPSAAEILGRLPGELSGELSPQPLGLSSNAYGKILRMDDTRFQLITTMPQAQALWTALASDARQVGSACWDWLAIRSGMPMVLPATQEQFVAQMVNYDLIGGINFKKGCYPGQEIVARMHYLGKLKRRMYLAHIATAEPVQAGDELFSADMEEQASGMIVNAATAPGGGVDVLAVVQTASRDTQTVHHQSLQGAALQFLALPYSVPDA